MSACCVLWRAVSPTEMLHLDLERWHGMLKERAAPFARGMLSRSPQVAVEGYSANRQDGSCSRLGCSLVGWGLAGLL